MTRNAASTAVIGMIFALLTGSITGCSALDVSNPSVIEDKNLDNRKGADDLWATARWHFADAVGTLAVESGMFSDEMLYDESPLRLDIPDMHLDRRESLLAENTGRIRYYGDAQAVRKDVDVAIPRVRAYGDVSTRDAQLAELLAIRGYVALLLAEDICPGFPLHRVVNFLPVYGPPLTTDEALTQAIAEFDSALVYVGDSVSLRQLVQVGKARALLAKGQFAEAGTLAATIPTGYVRTVQPVTNRIADFMRRSFGVVSVADREGSNGLDFISAKDPRVRVTATRKARYGDRNQTLFASDKYTAVLSPIVLANDIEARLIEAEAALNASSSAWLSIVNALRTDGTYTTQPNATNSSVTDTLWNAGAGGVAGLGPLSMPSTTNGQVDLLFRERAFWLYATGHRLGDLRRLIRFYHRAADTALPVGTYRTGGFFGTGTSLPFSGATEHKFNSANTGCTER